MMHLTLRGKTLREQLHTNCDGSLTVLLTTATFTIIFTCGLVCWCSAFSFAQTSIRFGGGVSATSQEVSRGLATQSLTPSTALRFLSDQQYTGYHGAVRFMIPASEQVGITVSATAHRFEQMNISVVDPLRPTVVLGNVRAAQTLVPLSGGIEWRLFRLLLSLYVTGELGYNLAFSTVHDVPAALQGRVSGAETTGRISGNVGIGTDLMLGSVGADVCLRYNHLNLIGRGMSEAEQTFLSLTLAIVLGTK
jgi:hypothetical protein